MLPGPGATGRTLHTLNGLRQADVVVLRADRYNDPRMGGLMLFEYVASAAANSPLHYHLRLIELTAENKLRLKGGDPFVLAVAAKRQTLVQAGSVAHPPGVSRYVGWPMPDSRDPS